MVKPAWVSRMIVLLGIGAVGLAPAGCGFVPEGRLDECHKMTRTLQSEMSRVRDKYVSLQSENTELTLRAQEDGAQLRAIEELVEHYRLSVTELQKDRDELAKAVQKFKSGLESISGQIRVSDASSSEAVIEHALALARRWQGAQFDRASMAFDVPANSLFEPKSDRLTADAQAWLEQVAGLLPSRTAGGPEPRVVATGGEASPVRRASVEDPDPSSSGALALARATAIRDLLAAKSGLDRAKIATARQASESAESPTRVAATRPGPRIEIRLGRPEPQSLVPVEASATIGSGATGP